MKKKKLIPFLFLCLLLSGCAQKTPQPESTPTPAPVGLDLFASAGQGTLSGILSSVYSPYEKLLTQVASSGCSSIGYAIPGQMLNQAGIHAEEKNAVSRDGWYNFMVDLGGDFTYSVWGQDVLDSLSGEETDELVNEDDRGQMENVSGDAQNDGGGVFSHRYVYDIAQDGTYGAIEVYSTLNGEVSGHERFDYMIVGEYLYYTDALLDLSAQAMVTESAPDKSEVHPDYPYIITEGIMTKDALTLCEYTVLSDRPGVPTDYPMISSLDESTLLSRSGLNVSLKVKDGVLTENYYGDLHTLRLE